jgi:hypothetical protein
LSTTNVNVDFGALHLLSKQLKAEMASSAL